MAVLTRITDFIPNTLIESAEVDAEFDQLVNILSGVSTNKDTLLKYNHATDPVLRVDQLGAGVIQQWLQNGSVKATMKGNGYLVGYPRCVGLDKSVVGNVGTGLDTLHSFSLPLGSLAADNDWLRWTAGGRFAANDDNKRIVASFDGQGMEDSGLVDIDGQDWKFISNIIRLSSTSVVHSTALWLGFLQFDSGGTNAGTGGRFISRSGILTVANLNSNNVIMLVQAESAAAVNDNITQNQTIVEACQMS